MSLPEAVTPQPQLLLRAPVNLVSSRARLYWTVRALPLWLIVAGIETVVLLTAGESARVAAVVIAVTAVLALAHLVVMPQWRYRVHRWEITAMAVYTQAGWIRQERRIAPIARIQTVDTTRGPFEQLFRLSNVTVTTASARGPLVIDALDLAVAEQTVATLTEQAQLDGGDGT